MKCYVVVIVCALAGSPPAREAWIEIMMAKVFIVIMESRLPQGRRGLKSEYGGLGGAVVGVASRKGGVD